MRNLNSEFGMRNSELFMLCKFTENINFRRGGFYIRPLKIRISGKFSVGDGFPVPQEYCIFNGWISYTKHHLKFGKNQADNLEYM